MSETEYKSNGKIVNVKRVKSGEKDKKERDRIEIFFGPDKRGVDGLTELIQALQAIEVGARSSRHIPNCLRTCISSTALWFPAEHREVCS
jgi:hypothetical protein